MKTVIGQLAIGLLFIACGLGQRVGDKCRLRTGGAGVCTWIDECESAQTELESDISPIICSVRNHRKIACCDLTQPVSTDDIVEQIETPAPPSRKRLTAADLPTKFRGKKSWEKCIEYTNEVYQPVISPGLNLYTETKYESQCASSAVELIIGGEKSAPKEFPHMAALSYMRVPTPSSWQCAGSLISDRFVLTAAHCIFAKGIGPVLWVRLGDLNLISKKDDADPTDYEVDTLHQYPKYTTKEVYHDIGLVKLKKIVKFSGYVRPACLNRLRQTKRGNLAIATGWGLTEATAEKISDDLMKVDLPYLPTARCNASYKFEPKLPRGVDVNIMICAGGRGKDTCRGDSGGPLQVLLDSPFDCMHRIVGLTSFGSFSCGEGTPAIYTRVSYYVPWIEGIVWPN